MEVTRVRPPASRAWYSEAVRALNPWKGTTTTGNWSPLALWMVMMRTASSPWGRGTFSSPPLSFFVKPFTSETCPLPQNFEVLKALSQASGGQYCDKDQINEVLSSLEVKLTEEERMFYRNLYDSPYLLAALMGLLVADWILRKTRNMV